MQITTVQRNDSLSLSIDHDNFDGKPLLRASELRLHKIFILNESLIESIITKVYQAFMKIVIEKLLGLIQ